MKRIVMLKDDRGSEEGTGTIQEYKAGETYTVSDALAACFKSTQSCRVEGDPEEEELLGLSKAEPNKTVNKMADPAHERVKRRGR